MNVQKINYQKELDKILKRLEEEGRVPTLLIHSCCAPCRVMCWNIYPAISGSRCFIITRIFILRASIQSGS